MLIVGQRRARRLFGRPLYTFCTRVTTLSRAGAQVAAAIALLPHAPLHVYLTLQRLDLLPECTTMLRPLRLAVLPCPGDTRRIEASAGPGVQPPRHADHHSGSIETAACRGILIADSDAGPDAGRGAKYSASFNPGAPPAVPFRDGR